MAAFHDLLQLPYTAILRPNLVTLPGRLGLNGVNPDLVVVRRREIVHSTTPSAVHPVEGTDQIGLLIVQLLSCCRNCASCHSDSRSWSCHERDHAIKLFLRAN